MKLFFAFLSMLLMNVATADVLLEGGIHTPTYCSATSINDCAHLRFDEYPSSSKESVFLVHIFPATEGSIISDVKVTLWMDMGHGRGHGSAPVDISPTEEVNHFNVENAWFVMMGQWQVILNFKENGVDQKIIIPINIKE